MILVQWFRSARDVTNGVRTIKEVFNDYIRFSVKEATVNDSGVYFIVARNKHGVDRAFCQVTVKNEQRYVISDTDNTPLTRTPRNFTPAIRKRPEVLLLCLFDYLLEYLLTAFSIAFLLLPNNNKILNQLHTQYL